MSCAEFDRDEGDLTPDVIEHAQDYIDRCDDAFVVCFQEGDDGDLKTAYAVGLWPSPAHAARSVRAPTRRDVTIRDTLALGP